MKSNIENNNQDAIVQFTTYWDKWHSEWLDLMKNNTTTKVSILNWPIPDYTNKKGKSKKNNVVNFFPEPYLHTGDAKKIKHIFLNINPGGAGPEQDYHKKDLTNSTLFNLREKFDYSNTIKEFLKTNKLDNGEKNNTAEWYSKRVKWTREIYGDSITKDNVLCADLAPWHTRKESDIIDYITDNSNIILETVIQPLLNIALQINPDNPKIIVRGVAFFNLINAWLKNVKKNTIKNQAYNQLFIKNKTKIEQYIIMDENINEEEKFFDKFNSYLAIYEYKKVKFFIFSGGANMDLPNGEYMVRPMYKTKVESPKCLKEFLND